MLAHSIIQPMMPGYLDEVDRAIETLRPDSWKGYTIGDPIFLTKKGSNWRLDDEKLVYPFYEKAVKSGVRTVCIHKGLMPADYEQSWPEIWQYATVWDLGKAARDWPQLTFVIYHSALRPFIELPDQSLAQFENDRSHRLGHRSRRDSGEVRRRRTSTPSSAPASRTPPSRTRVSPPRCSAR